METDRKTHSEYKKINRKLILSCKEGKLEEVKKILENKSSNIK